MALAIGHPEPEGRFIVHDTTLASSEARPDPALRSRRHTLKPPRTRIGRLALALQDLLESAVARVSRLPDVPVYTREQFDWLRGIEAGWGEVREELDRIMVYRDTMPSFHEIIAEVSTITTDHDWKTFFLMSVGREAGENARRCPRTMALLRRIPGVSTAFFSILSPGKHIPAHRGAYNGVLRLHLGLLVPEPRERCRIRVADEIHHWEEGRALIFDDSFNHEVWNDTDGYRVVLFVDFARPLLQPWDALNRGLLRLGPLAPLLRKAASRQKLWEKRFYRDKG
jgi:Aspartyl/asparaginyl beta-hydroxylase and related dioxygenases